MKPGKIKGHTHCLGSPSKRDHLAVLYVSSEPAPAGDGSRIMTSEWIPSEEEIDLIKAGCPIRLTVTGQWHPAVSLEVGFGASDKDQPKPATGLATVLRVPGFLRRSK